MTPRHSERGQATADYVALLAVVVVLLAVAATLAGVGAPGVVNAVRAQMAHALCVVSGRACEDARPRPCTVAMRRETRGHALNLAIFRLDKERFVVREQLSDGTVRLTVLNRFSTGLQGGLGAHVRVNQDLNSGGIGREATLGAQGVLGTGKVFYARDAGEADRIVRELDRGEQTPVAPREVVIEGGLRGLASLRAGQPLASLDLDWTAVRVLALRRNLQTGASTIVLGIRDEGSALAAAVVGGPAGASDAHSVLALTLDRRRRPVQLSLLASGMLAAGARLSKVLAAPLALSGSDDVPATLGGRRWEFGARVDLTDPEVAAAWKRFRGSPASLAAIRGLAQALREHAHLDVRTYRARNSDNGTSIGLGLGLRFGAQTRHAIERFNLLAASSRPPQGLWEPRLDCVA